ncbi:VOC family protein [Thalassotalea fonticola]|uniref:VOC family protein n=1 Tax=Thalassotalea fonticola TaxID=3065649 RepID=A0ABZ0GML1_9GAMM|nr:VOC family protein [Colwelliaceae bacterium S1-1]
MFKPKPKKLGHLVLRVSNLSESIEFYQQIVGLQVSDKVGNRMAFLHAGPDHHDLALVQMSNAEIEQAANVFHNVEHFAYQLDSYAEIEQATEMLLSKGIKITRGPGKHGSGENYFIVFQDPDGNNLEFYSDMRQITKDNPYEPSVWNDDIDTFDVWRCKNFVVEPPAGIKKKLAQINQPKKA